MTDILTISGWAQKPDSLMNAVPQGMQGAYIDYLNCKDVQEVQNTLLPPSLNTPIVFGWSLGAQIAVRAVAAGALNPKLLVLFSPPFQYVNGNGIECGTSKVMFSAFRHGYSLSPKKSLYGFTQRMMGTDNPLNTIFATMESDPARLKTWLHWLKILGEFSCSDLDFTHFPRTVIFHNQPDPITPTPQSQLFIQRLPNARHEVIMVEGHAPHLQAKERVQAVLREEMEAVRAPG